MVRSVSARAIRLGVTNEPLRIDRADTHSHRWRHADAAAHREVTVQRYREALESCAKPPPLVAFDDGDLWLADGLHRHAAYAKAGRSHAPVDIRKGSKRDALLFSAGANDTHGLPRTSEDERNVVRMLLADKECQEWSDRKIADACNVSHHTVKAVREQSTGQLPSCRQKTEENGLQSGTVEKRIGRDGKERPAKRQIQVTPNPSLADEMGRPVPPRLRDVFEAAPEFRAIKEQLNRVGERLRQLEATSAYLHADRRAGTSKKQYSSELFTAAKRIEDYTPALVCESCHGAGCDACSQSGWLPSGERHD